MSSDSGRRVVITGMGVISPIGCTLEATSCALEAGQSGVGPLTTLPTTHLPTSIAGEVRDFTGRIEDFGRLEGPRLKTVRKALKVMCRESQMGVAAALRALDHAGIAMGSFDPERSGVVYGADFMLSPPDEFTAGMHLCFADGERFKYDRWGAEGMWQMSPLWLLKYLPNMPACHIAIYNDLRGPNNSITQREAAANLAVGEAFRTIARGHAELMVAGATGTRVHPMKTLHMATQEELASNGAVAAKASRPFDRDRSGMVIGEGAAAIILEELESAMRRGATIYGEIIGTASSVVCDRHGVASRDRALVNAMRATLRDAGCSPADVGHVHAHGLSTRSSDVDEARAIAEVFADQGNRVPVTAAKSYFGNLGAGSGVVELVTSVLALGHGRLFPILNYETPDPECPVTAVTSNDVPAGDTFLNLNVTPQGQASCVMVRVYR